MDDEQLLQFSREQAEQQLNDQQLERYNELKEEQLHEGIEKKKNKDMEQVAEGLSAMRESVENDLSVTVRNIKFSTDINPSQVNKLLKVSRFEDRKVDSLNEEEVEQIRSNILDILAELSVNHDRSDWEKHFGDAGIVTPAVIAGELLDEIETVMEQKKSR